MTRLTGRTALVTGARRGIGAATAERLRRDGARVTAVDVAGGHDVVRADVTDPDAMAAAVEHACDGGRLDICVANAGIFAGTELVDHDWEEWRRVIEVNLVGVAVTFQAAAQRMVADGKGGRLLATASVAAWSGTAGATAYCASKAGVAGLVSCLAVELGPYGVTVNAVAPGEIETEQNVAFIEEIAAREGISPTDVRRRWVEATPIRRLGDPADIANVFAFLASEDAAFMSGQTLIADGGKIVT
jgi:NAD(P)-dependent dehydrogenase (short-subunit alcohol dehydrogenase family)